MRQPYFRLDRAAGYHCFVRFQHRRLRRWLYDMTSIFQMTGWFFARAPRSLTKVICAAMGELAWLLGIRRRLVLSNLAHAFPDRPVAWRRRMGRRTMRRMMEMFLLAIALPALSTRKRARLLRVSEELTRQIASQSGRPAVILVPHATLMEGLVLAPAAVPGWQPTSVLFRPLDYQPLDRWVRESRQKWGAKLVSRKAELPRLRAHLKEGGWVAILFDQHASGGALSLCFDRVCASTHLPGMLAQRHGADVCFATIERTGFWEGRMQMKRLDVAVDPETVTVTADRELEAYLRSHDERCAGWFWAHNRWKTHSDPEQAFNLEQKRSYLKTALRLRGEERLQRTEGYWVWPPADRQIAAALLPWLRALRSGRPNAALVICPPEGASAFWRTTGIADALRERASGTVVVVSGDTQPPRFPRDEPDLCIILDPDPQAARQARRTGTRRRFGVAGWNTGRRDYSHTGPSPRDPRNPAHWEPFFRRFGLFGPGIG